MKEAVEETQSTSGRAEADPERAPAVVSVKKSSKGCAVVILNDADLLERCVLQKVAVIDGVCVEVRRHTKRSLPEDEQPQGLFIAWGMRVERKVTVSEEGIEAYFNSLAGVPCPEGLVAQPPFEECHLRFPLSSEADAALATTVKIDDPKPELILGSAFCERTSIEGLWASKGR